MLLICNKSNKKTKRKNDKDQLILGQKYVLHNNYSGQKQGVNLICPTIQKKLEFILCIVSRQFVKTWTKWTLDILYKNSHFFVTTVIESNGIFCKMQVMSYIFITENHTLIHLRLLKLLMRKVRL